LPQLRHTCIKKGAGEQTLEEIECTLVLLAERYFDAHEQTEKNISQLGIEVSEHLRGSEI
jgi:hypothetical protein